MLTFYVVGTAFHVQGTVGVLRPRDGVLRPRDGVSRPRDELGFRLHQYSIGRELMAFYVLETAFHVQGTN